MLSKEKREQLAYSAAETVLKKFYVAYRKHYGITDISTDITQCARTILYLYFLHQLGEDIFPLVERPKERSSKSPTRQLFKAWLNNRGRPK